MSNISAGSYSYDYFLRNAYTQNRLARRTDYRSGINTNSLMLADSSAMKNITKKLRDLDYDSDHGMEIYRSAKVLVETYNNLLESSNDSTDSSIATLKKQLKQLGKDNQDALKSIGITLKSSNKLELDADTFMECSSSKIAKVLSGSSDDNLTQTFYSIASRMKRTSNRLCSTYSSSGSKTPTTPNTTGYIVDASL